MGQRALLVGTTNIKPHSPDILALPYAPYSKIFPHAAVIVHQGGSGTTGQALRAGRPMLVVPYGWDQPDNGARVERPGAGLCVSRNSYSAETAAAALHRLLKDSRFAARARGIGLHMQQEDGVTLACDAIERLSA